MSRRSRRQRGFFSNSYCSGFAILPGIARGLVL